MERTIAGNPLVSEALTTTPGCAAPLRLQVVEVLNSRPFWTMADQGVVSVGNFLSGVILARYLPKTGYGAFALLLETMLFLNTLQAAVVTYPMSIRGATHDRDQLRRFVSASLWMTLALLPMLGLAMGIGVLFGAAPGTGAGELLAPAISAVAAMVLWQMQETLRRGMMSQLRFMECVPGDALSYLGQVAALLLLARSGSLTLPRAFLAIGGTSALAIALQGLQVGLVRLSIAEVATAARDFWKLGHWTLLANLAGLITTIGYSWTLKIFHGLDATAAFSAMIMPLKLANPLWIGLGNLLVPAVANVAGRDGPRATIRIARRYALLGAAILFSYYAFLALFPTLVLRAAFGAHSPYLLEAARLRLYLLDMAVMYLELVFAAWLLGLGESRANGITQIFYALLTLLIALPATARYGVYGLIFGNLITVTLCVIAQMVMLRNALAAHKPAITTSVESRPAPG